MPYRKNELAETKRTPSKCDNKCVCTCGHVCAEHHWFNSEFIECRAGHCRCPKFTCWEPTKLEQRLTEIDDRIKRSQRQLAKARFFMFACLAWFLINLISTMIRHGGGK